MAKGESENFKLDEELKREIMEFSYENDVDKSKFIRASIILALPVFKKCPALIGIIEALPSKKQ